MEYTSHLFMVGDTITAAIKKYNKHDILPEEMVELLEHFKEKNGVAPLRPGMRAQVPVLPRHLSNSI